MRAGISEMRAVAPSLALAHPVEITPLSPSLCSFPWSLVLVAPTLRHADFDWSNSKQIWAKNKPMNDEEMLFQQVQMTTAASPGTTVWVYRCSVYAYPW